MTVSFGAFELDPSGGELRRGGRPVALAPRPFEVLALLAARSGELVTRNELRERFWAGRANVEADAALSTAIRQVRAALRDSADAPRFVETLTGRGYRFVAPLRPIDGERPAPPATRRGRGAARVATAALVVAIAIVTAGGIVGPSVGARPVHDSGRVMLAVLPLEDLSESAEELFGAGMTEELITRLARHDAERLGVIASTSAVRYRERSEPAGKIARALGVEYLVEGSVRGRLGDRRVSVRLTRASDQSVVWARSFTEREREAIDTQIAVAEQVSGALVDHLLGRPSVEPERPRLDSRSHELYWQARYRLRHGDGEDFERAAGELERVLERAPEYAPALAARAWASIRQAELARGDAAARYGEALRAADAALALAPELADAHAARARALLLLRWDWSGAGEAWRRALATSPGDASVQHWYAYYLAGLGRHAESRAAIERARRLDPLSRAVNSDYALIYYWAGEPGLALPHCRRTLALEAGFPLAAMCEEESLRSLGRHGEARAVIAKRAEASGAPAELLAALREGPDPAAYSAVARWRVARLTRHVERGEVSPFLLAVERLRLGQRETALSLLEQARELCDPWLVVVGVDPRLAPLRGEARFRELLASINLG